MPKRVDHDERRRQIAGALLRVAAARGLHTVGMREVAAEAGVSVRLVQYYFGTKEELLAFAMRHLAAGFGERARARIKAAAAPGDPRLFIEAVLAEGLPDDEDSRVFLALYTAYLALSLTDPALDIRPLAGSSGVVAQAVAGQLRAARESGRMPPGSDPEREAISLLALSAGLGSSVLAGQHTAAEAMDVIRYHLDRLLPPE